MLNADQITLLLHKIAIRAFYNEVRLGIFGIFSNVTTKIGIRAFYNKMRVDIFDIFSNQNVYKKLLKVSD